MRRLRLPPAAKTDVLFMFPFQGRHIFTDPRPGILLCIPKLYSMHNP